jgi:hypothetical protein
MSGEGVTPTLDTLVVIALLPKVLEAAQLLASVGVIKEEDVKKCVRVYVSKHPQINEHLGRERLDQLEGAAKGRV